MTTTRIVYEIVEEDDSKITVAECDLDPSLLSVKLLEPGGEVVSVISMTAGQARAVAHAMDIMADMIDGGEE